jgi:hypothetical protein
MLSRDTHSCVAFGYNHVRELNLDSNPFITEALRLSNPTLVDRCLEGVQGAWVTGKTVSVFGLVTRIGTRGGNQDTRGRNQGDQ